MCPAITPPNSGLAELAQDRCFSWEVVELLIASMRLCVDIPIPRSPLSSSPGMLMPLSHCIVWIEHPSIICEDGLGCKDLRKTIDLCL
jgi:hypothetical protein